ncbi:kinase-like domain-containing protein [Absidia repens]|uniref:Kinase-like domain-containing protein n=1 Tax=Absidia repens TaxID=90262 RepID=A0A1X2IES7_9FUNG|nr:kinase-like domain-containing protein [Absidia repens]
MLSRLKKIFTSKKEKRQNQVKVKVFNYTSDMRPLDSTQQQQEQQQDQQLPLIPWSKPTKDTSLDLKDKKNSNKKTPPAQQQLQPITAPQQPPPPPITLDLPLAPNEPAPMHSLSPPSPPPPSLPAQPQEPHKQTQISPAQCKQQQIPKQIPTPQQETNQDALEDGKQLQEQATLWIESNMRRKSTLPYYPSLDRYEIIKKLGDGAFSDVYRARDRRTGRNVAIKVAQKYAIDDTMIDMQHLHPNMKKKPRMTERANILKEVQIMRNLHHPNIVQLIQFNESRENYFLVLDLCEGGELFHRIVDLTYFSEDLSRHIIEQLAHAVYHLHEECGVVHRDIKPENILFEPVPIIPSEQRKLHIFDDASKKDEGAFIKDVGGGGIGQIKLADFGLSKVVWDSSAFTPCGTIGYTAPEIVCDQQYSKGVDMWAMGCVLYTMLCGFPPFYDESISALAQKVALGQFAFLSPWWDPISQEAKNLIQGLLCVDPSRRYTVKQVLQHPWITGKQMLGPNPTFSGLARGSVDDSESIRIQAMRNAAASSAINASSSFSPSSTQTSLIGSPIEFGGNNSNNNLDERPAHMMTDSSSRTLSDMGSTGSSTRRKDVFSPGMATLKEIFDITAAVQRMAEENTHRGESISKYDDDHVHQQKQNHTAIKSKQNDITQTAAASHHYQQQRRPKATEKTTKATAAAPAMMTTGFDLNMNNATLLKNRRKQIAAATPVP